MAREEVLERDVEEVDEARVVRDPRRVEVAEADEDVGAEQGYALLPRCSITVRESTLPSVSNAASPSSELAAVGSPK